MEVPNLYNLTKSRTQVKREIQNHQISEKMAAPIPNSVRPMDEGGKKSLMNYFGYTTKKGVSKEKRRSRLRALINSELIPSEHNVSYIKSFKDPGSLERILKIAQILGEPNSKDALRR